MMPRSQMMMMMMMMSVLSKQILSSSCDFSTAADPECDRSGARCTSLDPRGRASVPGSISSVESPTIVWSPRLENVEFEIAFLRQEIRKIVKTVATVCPILRLKCTKIQFPLGLPLVGELTALPRPPSWI